MKRFTSLRKIPAILVATFTFAGCAGSGSSTAIMQAASQPYPTSPPAAMELRPLQFPEFGEATLSNGLRLVVVENRELPIVSIRITMPAGRSFDPEGKEGLASLTATLLSEGTETRTAEQIAELIEGVGGSLNAGAGADFFTVSSTVLTDYTDLAFELIGDVLLNATFPEEDLERERARTLSSLRLAKSNPNQLANRYFAAAVYGDHPYGRTATEVSVNLITRDDIVAYASTRLLPEGALMVVAGDISLDEVINYTERYLGGWTGAAPEIEFPEPPAASPTKILLVHRPGSDQSDVIVGNLALRPGDDSYYAGVVGNRVLGGGSDARLFLILREEKGWTYGAYSSISRPRDVGTFRAGTQVRNSVTDSALTELMAQLRRIQTEPVPAAELEGAKGYLVGSFPRTIETPQQIANQVSTVKLLDLGDDYLATYRSRLASVTPEDIAAATGSIITPDWEVIVVVGDGGEIYDKLLSIAAVEIIDVDGNPLDPSDLVVSEMARFNAAALEAGSLRYNIMMQGNAMGTQTATLAIEDGVISYTEEMALPQFGMSQNVEVKFRADLSMISLNQTGTFGPMSPVTNVMYDGNRVTGSGQSPGATGLESVEIDTTLAEGTIDVNLLQPLVSTLELSEGLKLGATVFDGSDGTIRNVTITVGAAEEITVAAGTFEAFRVQLLGLETEIVLYVEVAAPHRVVKVEVIGQPIVMELEG